MDKQQITQADLANMVSDKQPDEEALHYEEKIALLTTERINLRVSPSVFDALLKMAEFNKMNVEDYCVDVLTEQLQTNVGQATIKGPSNLNGRASKLVTGPTFNVKRVD